jgi:hypothetical protein
MRKYANKIEETNVYGFLAGRVRVDGCGYGTALPDGFLPIAISKHMYKMLFRINL